MNAVFVQRSETIDFIPLGDVAAGAVIPFGTLVGIIKIPVKAQSLGALALSGVFDVVKPAVLILAGTMVYWNGENAVPDASGNIPLGIAAAHAPATSPRVRILLNMGQTSSTVQPPSCDGYQWQII